MTPQERKNFESIRDNVHSEPMTQVEAMKLALEALEWNLAWAEEWWDEEQFNVLHKAITALRQAIEQKQEPDVSNKLHFDCEFVDGTCADLTVYGSERDIKRLEARIKFWWNLEQAQKQEPWPEEPAGHMAGGVKPSNMTRNKAITQIYALFGAPNNADINLTGLSMLLDELMDSSPQQKQEPVGRFSKFTDGVWKEVTATSAGQPLYAAPPQRQPLTDEQIMHAWDEALRKSKDATLYQRMVNLVRVIEAAHGIKGEA